MRWPVKTEKHNWGGGTVYKDYSGTVEAQAKQWPAATLPTFVLLCVCAGDLMVSPYGRHQGRLLPLAKLEKLNLASISRAQAAETAAQKGKPKVHTSAKRKASKRT